MQTKNIKGYWPKGIKPTEVFKKVQELQKTEQNLSADALYQKALYIVEHSQTQLKLDV